MTLEELRDEEVVEIQTRKQKIILYSIANSSRCEDLKKNRENDMSTARVRECFRECRMRCATSGVLMELKSGARNAHMDRIDDTIGHIRTNVEFKIYLFSNAAKLTRKQFLQVFLNQTRVFLTSEVRAKAQADFDKL